MSHLKAAIKFLYGLTYQIFFTSLLVTAFSCSSSHDLDSEILKLNKDLRDAIAYFKYAILESLQIQNIIRVWLHK